MSLFKRGNVWWSYFYQDGVRQQYSTGTSNRRQAETIEAKLKEEANNRRFQIVRTDPQMTFGELAARFISSGSVRPHHLYHLKFLLPFFEHTQALRVTKALADEFRKRRRAVNHAIKDATINRDLSVLRHILYWAVDEQLLAANPLSRMKMARERRIRRQVLSVAEEELLLEAAKDHLRTMTIIALDTGMRRGEITSQQWEDIDFPRRLLFVTRSKTPEGESREIPLTKRLTELLLHSRADTRSTHSLLIKLERFRHRLLAHFHSHPGNGADATHPSGTDENFQRRLESAGHVAVMAIFSRDGFVRFLRLDHNLEIEIYGEGVEKHAPGIFRLTNLD